MKPLLLVWAMVLLLAGCEHTQTKSQIVEDLGETDEANAQRSREILYATLWMQHSAEYRAAAMQAFEGARAQLKTATKCGTAEAGQLQQSKGTCGAKSPWAKRPAAIIFDLDETLLDNSAYQAFQIKRRDGDALEPLQISTVPRVSPGDEVHIKARNDSDKYVDINVLYVGSDYSITHIVAERLAPANGSPDAGLKEGLLAFTDTSFGMERMIAVLTEAPPQSEKEDLAFLAQDGVPSATRAVGGSGFSDMLADIGTAPATRSVMKLGDKSGPKGAVMIFPMETVPHT